MHAVQAKQKQFTACVATYKGGHQLPPCRKALLPWINTHIEIYLDELPIM